MAEKEDSNMDEEETITVQLTVTARQGAPRLPLAMDANDTTPHQLRQKVSEATKIPESGLKLIYRGRLIADDDLKQVAAEYKLEEGSVLHCIGAPVDDGEKKSPAAATAVPSASTSTAPPAAVATPMGSTAARPPPMAAASLPVPSIPAASAAPQDPLQAALRTLRAGTNPKQYETAVTTLDKILSNILKNPLEDKYRRVKKQNAAFQKRLGGLPGGHDAMLATGFVVETEASDDGGEQPVYVMQASPEAWPKLQATKTAVEAAVRQAQLQAAGSSQPPMMGMPPAVPPMGGVGAPPPELMASLLNNPGFQQQLLNDPRVRDDPVMQRVLRDPQAMAQISSLMQNPAIMAQVQAQMQQDPDAMQEAMAAANMMMQQQQGGAPGSGGGAGSLANMMSDPRMQQAMAAMMQQRQQGGAAGGSQPGSSSQPPPAPGSTSTQNGSAANDEEMTEEEMIAEAIRRSLQDGNNP